MNSRDIHDRWDKNSARIRSTDRILLLLLLAAAAVVVCHRDRVGKTESMKIRKIYVILNHEVR